MLPPTRPRLAALTVLLLVAAASGIAAAARADDAAAATLALPSGWRAWTPTGKAPAHFTAVAGGGVAVASQGGVSFLVRPLTPAEAAMPHLAWRWRVDAAPPPTDLAVKGGDDRPLAVHLWFPGAPPGRSSVTDRIATTAARLLGQAPLPQDGYLLSYVWGGSGPAGTLVNNPYIERAMLLVRRDSNTPLAAWQAEEVDIAGDFRHAFGVRPPMPPAYIAISTDTDATQSHSAGVINSLVFLDAAD